mmetsp:Transcript_699/g.2717  ORF Transcript_699/g.2717 Transcript_699/m.2717 type:complete len:248 (-) Transcript_699:1992-2735(-)
MSQLTLAWAVNQSRRVFRAKKKQVHPEDVSSAGTDGGGSSYHGSPVKSRGVAIGNQRRAKKPGCLGALMALMGFGRGGSKVRAAARQMRQRRAGDPNNRPPGSPGFGPPASPLSRGGLSSGGSARSVLRSPVSPSPMPRPDLNASPHRPRSTGGLDGRAASRGTTAEHLEGGMGYRDADEVSTRTSSREFSSSFRKSRLGPAAPPPSVASGFEELDETLVDDDSAPRIGTPGRATSMGNASWTQPGY